MPNIAGQTAHADDEFDDGLPSAAATQEPVTTDSPPAANDLAPTSSADPSSGSAEIDVDNSCASLKFLCYITLVDMARSPFPSVSLPSDTSPFDSSLQQVRPAEADGQLQSSSDLTDPKRRRCYSMPNIAVLFPSVDTECHKTLSICRSSVV